MLNQLHLLLIWNSNGNMDFPLNRFRLEWIICILLMRSNESLISLLLLGGRILTFMTYIYGKFALSSSKYFGYCPLGRRCRCR